MTGQNPSSITETSLVSIVITSYTVKRLKDVCELIDSLAKQTYQSIEVLIIVEKSQELYDKLEEYISNRYKDGLSRNIRLILCKNDLGMSQARNLGAKIAKGSIIAFIDDDAVPSNEWVEEIVRTFEMDPSIIGVTGQALPLWEGRSMDWLPKELHWIIGATTWYDDYKMQDVRHTWGMNMAFKRNDFLACGGFSAMYGLKSGEMEGIARFPHEDVEFCLRLKKRGGHIVYNPSIKVFHKVSSSKVTLRFFVKHAYIQGFAKRVVKELTRKYGYDNYILSREHNLLRRILLILIPNTIRKIFRKPKLALHQLFIIVTVLSFLAIGYYSPFYFFKLRKYIK